MLCSLMGPGFWTPQKRSVPSFCCGISWERMNNSCGTKTKGKRGKGDSNLIVSCGQKKDLLSDFFCRRKRKDQCHPPKNLMSKYFWKSEMTGLSWIGSQGQISFKSVAMIFYFIPFRGDCNIAWNDLRNYAFVYQSPHQQWNCAKRRLSKPNHPARAHAKLVFQAHKNELCICKSC